MERKQKADNSGFFGGIIIGMAVGIALTLWHLPKQLLEKRQHFIKSTQSLRQQIEPSELINDSITHGKALAKKQLENDSR